MNLLLLFIILNIANVIIQTVKSLLTIKGNKYVASLANAVAFGLYTIVVVYMMCDLPLFLKAFIVAMCNLVGVFIVKYFEEKAQKDKLWKVEATVSKENLPQVVLNLRTANLSFNYIDGIGRYSIINIYCPTQEQSKKVKKILDFYNAKYFVAESKTLE